MEKKFSELSPSEIQALSKEEFKNISPFEKKSCYDCTYCKPAVTLWCRNEEAVKARGTAIPGVIKCPFWEPDWKYIKDKYKTEENGYKIKPKEIIIMENTNNLKPKKESFWQRTSGIVAWMILSFPIVLIIALVLLRAFEILIFPWIVCASPIILYFLLAWLLAEAWKNGWKNG